MKKILIVSFCLLAFNLFSQNEKTLATDPIIGMGNSLAFYHVTKDNLDVEIDGSRYLFQEMKPGKIKMKQSVDYIDDLHIRYDVFKDQLEIIRKGVSLIAISSYISEFIIDNETETYQFFNSNSLSNSPNKPPDYLRLIHEGNRISVFAKYSKKRQENDSSQPYSSFRDYVEYVDELDFFFFDKSTSAFTSIKSKKKLMADFPVLKDFGKISNAKLKNEKFLPELAMFLEMSN